MANHKSAQKRLRQNIKRREHNRDRRAQARTVIKRTQTALQEGNLELAQKHFLEAERTLSKAARRRLFHKRNVSRKLSRLNTQIRKAAGAKK